MRPAAELVAALSGVKLRAVHGPWSRCVGYRHLLAPPPGGGAGGSPQPLWGGAAKIAGARFTPKGGFDSLYLASDPVTALTEVSALVALPGGPVPVRTAPLVIVSVDGVVSRVLDLTDADTLAALGTNPQEITGTWVKGSQPAHADARTGGLRLRRNRQHPVSFSQVPWRGEPSRLSRPAGCGSDRLPGGLRSAGTHRAAAQCLSQAA